MKIIINAQMLPGRGAGGVETVLIALIAALGKLEGPEKFIVVQHPDAPDWIRPFAGPNTRVISAPPGAVTKTRPPSVIRRVFSPVKKMLVPAKIEWSFPSVSNGFLESVGADVIHFPCQDFTICSIPSVYSPHDLQHRHFPQFFSPQSLVWREETYRKGCDYSQRVVVGSQFVKNDLVTQFGMSPSKIQVIPLAPPLGIFNAPSSERLSTVRERYRLHRPFILYPSMTWPHKNHIRLIEALKQVRARSDLALVCTGYQNEHWSRIESHIAESEMQSSVQFLGLVPAADLAALYRLCEFVVIPTLFESTSEPIFEAWEAGKAVACSNVTALPEQTAGCALLFDPYSVESIGSAIEKMTSERPRLEALGRKRLSDFSWERSAMAYRALYRQCARVPLDEQDRRLLETDWMRKKYGVAA